MGGARPRSTSYSRSSLHRDTLGHASAHEIPHRRPAEVVRNVSVRAVLEVEKEPEYS